MAKPKPVKYKSRNKNTPQKLSQGGCQPSRHKEELIASQKTFLERIESHHLYKFVGILGTIFAISFAIADVFREPEIQHSTAQVDDPFVVRFSLHNPSAIFPMTDMRISCVLERVKFEYNLSLGGIPLDDGIERTLPPEKTAEYQCPFNEISDELVHILHATVRINTTFKTLGVERTVESEPFNWDVTSREWIKGEIIN